jgi:2,4-didehydro-3-deoxy-L-rhamnonate hydrolase
MTRFTLASLQTSDGPKAAMGINYKYHLLSLVEPLLVDATCKSILQSWDASMPLLQGLAEKIAAGHVAQQHGVEARMATVLPPVLYPDTLLAVGANYPKGDQPMTGGSTSMAFFIRPPKTTLVGAGDTVVKPSMTNQFDWECELVIFVGRRLRNASKEEAALAVAGYAVGLDLACRDLLEVDNELKVDLVRGKSQDTMAPCGPAIMPAKFVSDVNNLRIQLFVNDRKMIDASTCEMISKVEDQLSNLSEFMTIEPGDMLFTGSPTGSAAQHGNCWLQSGDRIRAEIEDVGVLDVNIRDA